MTQGDAWTEERIARLKLLWMDGLSASAISVELGGGLTRNAIIGKIHRIGLEKRTRTTPTVARRPSPREAVRPQPRPVGLPRTSAPTLDPDADLPAAPIPADSLPVGDGAGIVFAKLTEKTCRFPLGGFHDRATLFCGASSDNSKDPYCSHHQRVAYNGTPARRVVNSVRKF